MGCSAFFSFFSHSLPSLVHILLSGSVLICIIPIMTCPLVLNFPNHSPICSMGFILHLTSQGRGLDVWTKSDGRRKMAFGVRYRGWAALVRANATRGNTISRTTHRRHILILVSKRNAITVSLPINEMMQTPLGRCVAQSHLEVAQKSGTTQYASLQHFPVAVSSLRKHFSVRVNTVVSMHCIDSTAGALWAQFIAAHAKDSWSSYDYTRRRR